MQQLIAAPRPGDLSPVYSALLEGAVDIGAEVVQFVAARIAEDVYTQHEIMHCKTPTDLVHIQMRFLQKAFEQYSAETGKLITLGNDTLRDALTKGHAPVAEG
ncbi:MAG: phasin family protein [Albidovulum sp.]|uniref:phasin family protein n=1 Tax=Albidovulum sp. TaxID=1872424 RepID=UPI003C9717DE